MSGVLAQCVVNFFYTLASAILQLLKSLIEQLILFIDAQIAKFRALLAIIDALLNPIEAIWAFFEAILEQLKNALLGGIQKLGPAGDLCPEFFQYFTDPVLALFESFSVFTIYKENYFSALSLTSYFDRVLTYWTATKAVLLEAFVVIDDAILAALEKEAAEATG